MARGAVQKRQRAKPQAAPKKRRAAPRSVAEQQMFFPRLRRQAKWVFVFLALVFAVGFVAFGVGTGSTGLSELLQGNVSLFGHGGGSSISKAQKRVTKHPDDAAAYKNLASVLQEHNKHDEAIAPLETYTSMRPKDVEALNQLASLYLERATTFRNEAAAAQQAGEAVFAAPLFLPDPASKLGQAVGNDPIYSAVSASANSKVNDASSQAQQAFSSAVTVYQRLANVQPRDPSVPFNLAQAAEQAGNIPVAVEAYKRFLVLAPQDPTAPAIRARLKQLQPSKPASSAKASR
jgi:tetratricopeptide (TPR) repeat protein